MKRLAEKLAAFICLIVIAVGFKGNIISKRNFLSGRAFNEVSTIKKTDSLVVPGNKFITKVLLPDWKKAPNSYIFDIAQNSEGLLIPVKKHMQCGKEEVILMVVGFLRDL